MSQITSKVIVAPHNLFKLEFLLASGIRSWAGWVGHFNRSPPWCTLLHDDLLLPWCRDFIGCNFFMNSRRVLNLERKGVIGFISTSRPRVKKDQLGCML
jgi:hypothetical protein